MEVFFESWIRVTGSAYGKLKLADLLSLFDVMESLNGKNLLSTEYKNFLIEFILECPSAEVDKEQFNSLMERLFECPIHDVINGKLVQKSDYNYTQTQFDDNSKYGNNTGRHYRESEEFTQTMNNESKKFNLFLKNEPIDVQEQILRDRIQELRNMVSKSENNQIRDYRSIDKMKNVLIEYLLSLDELNISRNEISNKERSIQKKKVINRLKDNVEKQDILIKELKKKFGDGNSSRMIGKLKMRFLKLYIVTWNMVKLPLYVLTGFLVLNFIFVVVYERLFGRHIDNLSDSYWGV
ncbi:hypothetical protein DAPK24_003520 [Pichia kluyveri]|uniref:Monopolar spindle protein 2 n=1 Tax=Pichia kluyveri TaxID=36015 RepID=A0AAV5QY84_PICKL|nr:hypothetical protein DAPK24_003520 [Pichia kluyveri]